MNFFNYIIEHKLTILIISMLFNGLLILTSGFLTYNLYTYECEECTQNDSLANVSKVEEDITDKIYVDVKGSVKNPGVYETTNESIINDVIKLAGGFTKNAYKNNINLSKKVTNELVIYVYSKSEYQKLNVVEPEISECVCPTYDIGECTSNGNSMIVTDSNNSSSSTSINNTGVNTNTNDKNINKLININTASLEELMTLNGVGEAKAKAIIEYRTKSKFQNIEDIKNISGIGDKAFEKIKDYITV